jgi:hypothetical protein
MHFNKWPHLIQGGENTLQLILSRALEGGFIKGTERHLPWIEGPTLKGHTCNLQKTAS